MGTVLGIPILGTLVLWGLYWGSPILGNYHIENTGQKVRCHKKRLGYRGLGKAWVEFRAESLDFRA